MPVQADYQNIAIFSYQHRLQGLVWQVWELRGSIIKYYDALDPASRQKFVPASWTFVLYLCNSHFCAPVPLHSYLHIHSIMNVILYKYQAHLQLNWCPIGENSTPDIGAHGFIRERMDLNWAIGQGGKCSSWTESERTEFNPLLCLGVQWRT